MKLTISQPLIKTTENMFLFVYFLYDLCPPLYYRFLFAVLFKLKIVTNISSYLKFYLIYLYTDMKKNLLEVIDHVKFDKCIY